MKKTMFCLSLMMALALGEPCLGICVVSIPALSKSPTPTNPVKVLGRVIGVSPIRLSDGGGTITVSGLTADVGDFLVVTGDWDGSSLTVSGPTEGLVGPARTEMVYIPAGDFMMGNNGSEQYSSSDEFPQHSVYLSGYWIGKYEVTRGEYRQFMNAGGYSNPAYWSTDGWNWKGDTTQPEYWAEEQNWGGTGKFTQTDRHPVVGITYYEAEAFCSWAHGRLPTEAEWEKAARRNRYSANVYPWGNTWDSERCNGFYDTNPAGGGYQKYQTAPAGSYPSGVSPYGCLDMAGNVSEWCKDWYQGSYYSQTPSGGWVNPQGPPGSGSRVLRGGGWGSSASNARCAYRNYYIPETRWYNYGFRMAH